MKKKIIIMSVFLIVLSIAIFVYLHSKNVSSAKTFHSAYAKIQFKNSDYQFPIFVRKGTTLQEALIKLRGVDHNTYNLIQIDKSEVSFDYKIFSDCIFTVK